MRTPGAKVPSEPEGFRYAGVWAGRVPQHRDLRETWFKGNPLAHRAFAHTTLALPSQVGGPFRASLDAYLFSTRLEGVRQRIFRGHNTGIGLILKGFLSPQPLDIVGFTSTMQDKDLRRPSSNKYCLYSPCVTLPTKLRNASTILFLFLTNVSGVNR